MKRAKFTRQPWGEAEVARLVKLWAAAVPITDIAEALGRKPTTVRAKVSHLRSTDPAAAKKLKYRVESPGGKLKAADIPGIRLDKRPLRLIGLQYGVSAVTIFKVKRGETWRDA